jgi:tetratricopeptide (TPR) repeat protein
MLETIREYAAEQLDASSEADELRRRHAEHYLALAEEAEPNVFASRSPAEWIERLELEHDNLRAALDFFESSGETQLVMRLAGGLGDFWHLRGYLAEGIRRLETALQADETDTPARAKALNAASTVEIVSGDPGTGRRRAEEALELNRRFGDTAGTANSLWALSYALTEEGNPVAAGPPLEESVRLFRELGDEDSAVGASRTLAFSYAEAGDLDRARVLHAENLRHAREIGNQQIEARSLGSLGFVAAGQGRVGEAVPLLREAYRIDSALGNRLEIAVDVGRFAKVLAAAGRAETATRLLSCSEALCEELDAAVPWVTRMYEQILETIRVQLDERALAEAWELGRNLTADDAVALALRELRADA